MRFFIKRGPVTYKGKTFTRSDKYIDMDYEEAKPYIRRGQLMKSFSQEVENEKNNVEPVSDVSTKPKSNKRGRKKRANSA